METERASRGMVYLYAKKLGHWLHHLSPVVIDLFVWFIRAAGSKYDIVFFIGR